MNRFGFFQDFLDSIRTHGARLPIPGIDKLAANTTSLEDLAAAVMKTRGEASALAHAESLLECYNASSDDEKLEFFRLLLKDYDLDTELLATTAVTYRDRPDAENFRQLAKQLDPKRRNLFRRLNSAPEGTAQLVRMRAELLKALKIYPELGPLDMDMAYLFRSWFNRGFLMMRPIDWNTPANILEKIIAYEAVHEISNWRELRSRLEPPDRRCFAFFHPAMPDEPLIFVEVALTSAIADQIAKVLEPERDPIRAEEATVAVFYSISNCQRGLKGVSFGNFLIKQVALELKAELPQLKDFVTLSPVPGFMRWLRKQEDETALLEQIDDPGWQDDEEQRNALDGVLPAKVAEYLLNVKQGNGEPLDPVARFHLGNGARLERINFPGDLSPRGLENSASVMVNYYYDLAKTAQYHEQYAGEYKVVASKGVSKLANKDK